MNSGIQKAAGSIRQAVQKFADGEALADEVAAYVESAVGITPMEPDDAMEIHAAIEAASDTIGDLAVRASLASGQDLFSFLCEALERVPLNGSS